MESVNVLITAPVGEDARQKIISLSPRIKLTDGFDLIREELRGDSAAQEKLSTLLADTEVIYGRIPRDFNTRAPMLKWIQLISAGVNMFTDAGVAETPGLKITTTRGIQSTPIAEFVFALMLIFVKQAPAFLDMKRDNV